jgi:DNA-binding transcriptional regulator YhcF (GntR family)
MEFKDNLPIYLQISHYICDQILEGKWTEGERILSVRELGVLLQVNPNTVMRTYEQLQSDNIIFNKRGIGFFVADGAKAQIIANRKNSFLTEELPIIFRNAELLGMSVDDIVKAYKDWKEK